MRRFKVSSSNNRTKVTSSLIDVFPCVVVVVSDVTCDCKSGYVGDGFSCTGNLLQVLTSTPTFSNFLSVSLTRRSRARFPVT